MKAKVFWFITRLPLMENGRGMLLRNFGHSLNYLILQSRRPQLYLHDFTLVGASLKCSTIN
jgi:hypothetical protein